MAITLDGTTGVTAAEFDGTVDASNLTGTLPAIDGSALTGIDTAPPTDFGAVGTYAMAGFGTGGQPIAAGTTYSGSSLNNTTLAFLNNSDLYGNNTSAFTGSGTWRAMNSSDFTSSSWWNVALFVRVA